jgi:hypothetical protein
MGHVARSGDDEKYIKNVIRKIKGKRPLGRPRREWDDNIK